MILLQLSTFCAVHPEANAFDDLDFGANLNGIHFAAGPDRMHLMLEGLGTAILGWTTILVSKAGKSAIKYGTFTYLDHLQGRLPAMNEYISKLEFKTSDLDMAYSRVAGGIENLSVLSASKVPGVLFQVRTSNNYNAGFYARIFMSIF